MVWLGFNTNFSFTAEYSASQPFTVTLSYIRDAHKAKMIRPQRWACVIVNSLLVSNGRKLMQNALLLWLWYDYDIYYYYYYYYYRPAAQPTSKTQTHPDHASWAPFNFSKQLSCWRLTMCRWRMRSREMSRSQSMVWKSSYWPMPGGRSSKPSIRFVDPTVKLHIHKFVHPYQSK